MMLPDSLILAASDLITWQDRLLSPVLYHWRPLLCSVLVGGVLGLLGCFVILRRMALIGDAISHAVLPGVVVAFLLVSTGVGGLFVGALVAAVLTAVGINLVTRVSRVKEDAAIGIVFTSMFALGVILISQLPMGTHFDLKCFLFGDPLAVQAEDLATAAIVAPLVVLMVVVLFHPLKLMSFDATLARTMGFNVTILHYTLMVLLSATIVAALRSVGVVMAVAMLVTPAAVAYQLTNRLHIMLWLAALTGTLSAGVGMFLAFLANTPPGPTMVLVATLLFALAAGLAPERGLLTVWLRRRRLRAHIAEEDVLKELARVGAGALSVQALQTAVSHTPGRQVASAADRLLRQGMVAIEAGAVRLTDSGSRRALEMLRSHRLWETYLAEQDVDRAHLHDEAERLEHAHRLAEDLAETLGDPRSDPHGKPIPGRSADAAGRAI